MARAKAIIDNWKDSSTWSTAQLPASRQFDRWCEFVNEAHLHWSIERNSFEFFPAFIREGRFEDFRTANLTASPRARVKGTRGPVEIAKDSEALYNFLYIVEGSECLTVDGNELELFPGTLVLWDSTRPTEFLTGPGLHQVTLAVTHSRLQKVFPLVGDFVGQSISCGTGLNRLFVDHLLALDDEFGELSSEQAWRVLDTTLDLAVAALENSSPSLTQRPQSDLLLNMKRYIEENLEDYELCVTEIAGHHGISVRHAHRLFGEMGVSISNYIMQRRLERCRHDLLSATRSCETITSIAFRWGFNDSSTFSKVFKREFGISPRAFRTRL